MSDIGNQFLSNYAKLYSATSANQGSGARGWSPEVGVYSAFVTGMRVQEGSFKIKADNSEYSADVITFQYTLFDDPGSPDSPRSFYGSPFVLPHNPEEIKPEGQQMRISISLSRLKGHMLTILGPSGVSDNARADLLRCQSLVDEGVVAVRVDVRPSGKTGEYKEEFLTQRLSSTSA
jgi:hypothetical protein